MHVLWYLRNLNLYISMFVHANFFCLLLFLILKLILISAAEIQNIKITDETIDSKFEPETVTSERDPHYYYYSSAEDIYNLHTGLEKSTGRRNCNGRMRKFYYINNDKK